MFKIGEIKMSELAGTAFPELAGREGLLYGVSDPEAPENNSMIYVRTEVADSYTKVRDSIFVTKEEIELPGLHESCVQLKASMQKSLYGVLLETYKKLLPKAELVQKNGSYISSDVKIGTDVEIAPFCVIGADVQIGDHCKIGAGTIIKDHVRIGSHVEIQEKCLIGVDDIVWKTAYAEICLTWPEPSLKMAACCWLDPFWQLVIPGLQFLEKAP